MIRITTWCSFGVLAVLLGGCQPNNDLENKPVSPSSDVAASAVAPQVSLALSAADSGRSVSLQTGQALSVSLEGNASTGYSWQLGASGAPVLAQVGEPAIASAASAPGLVGAPEMNTWTFIAREAGDTVLKLEYRRSWEKDSAPAQIFEVKVSVADKSVGDKSVAEK